MIVGSQAGVEVYGWPNLKPLRKVQSKLLHVHDITFSPDGKQFVVVGGSPAAQGSIELFRWPAGTLVRRQKVHKDLIYSVAWHPTGKELATASADRTCRILHSTTGKPVTRFTGHSRPVLDICYTPDGKAVLSASRDQTIRMWDPKTGRSQRSFGNHVGAVQDLAFRPGQDRDTLPMLASISVDRTVRLWQPTIGRMVRFARLPNKPLSLTWTADGKEILVGCVDGKVRRVDPESVRIRATHPALKGWIYSLARTPRGNQVLAAGSAGEMKVVSVFPKAPPDR